MRPLLTKIGGPHQLRLQASLSAATVQLTGHLTDATNVNTDSTVSFFIWVSRNSYIATVDGTGLVSLLNKGEVTVEAQYPRCANTPFCERRAL
jgi:Bacterial Ig-like domain (group 2)